MAEKWRRKLDPASGATKRQKSMRRRTWVMKADAKEAESTWVSSVTMENPVRSHIAPRKYLAPV